MSNKAFFKLLLLIVISGSILTTVHLFYAAYAYEHSSVIHFVSKEYWP